MKRRAATPVIAIEKNGFCDHKGAGCLNFCKDRKNTANRTLRCSIGSPLARGKRPPEAEIRYIQISMNPFLFDNVNLIGN